MPQRPYLIALFPYTGDGLGNDPRFRTQSQAEDAARGRTAKNGGEWSIVVEADGTRTVLGTTRRDVNGIVWTDVSNAGTRLL